MIFERKVKFRYKEFANTVYVDKDDEIKETDATDLSDIDGIEKIITIGYYPENKRLKIKIVKMPEDLTEVPEYLPKEIVDLSNAFENHKTKTIKGIEK
ncbi:hypothetical protein JIY74_33730 [Vibrio harveyi]|nr:hypothetical protein [Vibrio harveyi]